MAGQPEGSAAMSTRNQFREPERVANRALARRIEAIRRRCLTLEERYASSVQRVAPGLRPSECFDSTWVEANTPVELMRDGMVVATSTIGDLPAQPRPILLRASDTLWVTKEAQTGRNAMAATRRRPAPPAQIPCTLEAVFRDARVGHRRLLKPAGNISRNCRKTSSGSMKPPMFR
jgi:hypothetical protein